MPAGDTKLGGMALTRPITADHAPGGWNAERAAQLAEADAISADWADWHDAHAKLNAFRNGMYDDPVKDHQGYLSYEADRPFQIWSSP